MTFCLGNTKLGGAVDTNMSGARSGAVGSDVYMCRTDHAVEREILNPFLVWTQ